MTAETETPGDVPELPEQRTEPRPPLKIPSVTAMRGLIPPKRRKGR